MKNWYYTLSPRERNLVLYGGIAAILILFWMLAIKPLMSNHKKYTKLIASQKSTLVKMQKQSVEITTLQSQASKPKTINSGNPQQLIEQSLKTWRLKPNLERMQSQGANGIRLTLKNANADRVVRFFHELEDKHQLLISNLTMNNAKKEVGFADIRLTVKRQK